MTPLSGIKVVDLTHALAGPFCTHQLQLLGADVLKVEAPDGGDDFRARPGVFPAINAGKRSITVNLKSPDGFEILRRLLLTADVVVENYRPGVAAKLGIEWAWLHELNPRLIFCSISGYGQEGPLRDVPAIEWAVQAMSGMSAAYLPEDADRRRLGLGVLDPFSGYVAFSAILAALIQRQQTGEGQRIDVAMLDAALSLMSSAVAGHFLGAEERPGVRPTMARFPAKDGTLFIAALHQRWFERLCQILGAPELATDPRFADHPSRQRNADALTAALEALTATFSAAELEQALVRAGLPASIVRSLSEILAHPHVRARGILAEVPPGVDDVPPGNDVAKPLTLVGSPFRLGDGGTGFQGPVPALGHHTGEVLTALGYSDDEVAALRASGAV